jgi:polar amino acid transport system permease protein
MTAVEAMGHLWTWTPFLAAGFLLNILISLVAMAIGTGLGGLLAWARASGRARLAAPATLLTHISRNIPTFVFLYYLAFLIPIELQLGGTVLPVPGWIKASLALSVAVVGFASDTLLAAIREWRLGQHAAAWLFVPAWSMYLVIIVMASSTASVIGVSEIVSRCNIVAAAIGDDRLIFWVYGYAMLWFFLFCWPLGLIIGIIRRRLERRTGRVLAVEVDN